MSSQPELRMTRDEVAEYLDKVFPESNYGGRHFEVEAVRPLGARVRMNFHERFVRPGGTISGPAMFTLADYGLYVAILASIGPVALAVTTNLTINFLHRPAASDMIAEVEIIKLGRRLAVGEVGLYSIDSPDMAAHVTATYSIPPDR